LLVATKENPAKVRKRPLLGFGKEIEEEILCTPVRLWDVETGKEVQTFQGPRGEVGRAAFSPDGKLVLAAERGPRNVKTYFENGNQIGGSSGTIQDGQAYIWDASTGKLVQTLKGHEYGITYSAWAPDSERVLTADYSIGFKTDDGAARIWNVKSGKPVVKLEGNRGELRMATFSPDGKHVIILHHPAVAYVEIWDAATGRIVRTLGRPTWYKYGQYPDPKSNRVVYKRNDRVVYVHEGQDTGHTAFISHAAYSRDGRRIITTSWDRTARLWDSATGKQLLVLRGHIMSVQHAAFSADGKRIVTASDDETARVWDAETGAEIFTLAGHTAAVLTAVFSPDGKSVATGSADGTARIWPLDPLPVALSRKPRELTADERERFGISMAANPKVP
jgi:WD40 repeat protein